MARRRSSEKEQFWRDILHSWQRSGLSVRDFCQRRHLSEPSFYAWRRALAQRDRQAAAPCETAPPTFIPVRVTPATAPSLHASAIEIVVAGRVVRVPPGFDADTLRSLLAVLEAMPC